MSTNSTKVQPATATATATASNQQPGSTSNKPLRSGDIDPAIRSAPSAHSVSYEHYLQTAWWRQRRNRALRLAGYECSRCGVSRQLEVHHLSYERLGAELDSDLEVVCRGCHLGHHVVDVEDNVAVYVKVVSSVLAAEDFTCLPDLIEAVKAACARLRLPYNGMKVYAAIQRVDRNRKLTFRWDLPHRYAQVLERSDPGRPLTRAEAAESLARLGYAAFMKHMPEVKVPTLRQAERTKALKILAQGILEQVKRCEEAERES